MADKASSMVQIPEAALEMTPAAGRGNGSSAGFFFGFGDDVAGDDVAGADVAGADVAGEAASRAKCPQLGLATRPAQLPLRTTCSANS